MTQRKDFSVAGVFRRLFNKEAGAGVLLSAPQMEEFMPVDRLSLGETRFKVPVSTASAIALFDILADRAKGRYHATISVYTGKGGICVSEMKAHRVAGQVDEAGCALYRLDKLVIDGTKIDLTDSKTVLTQLNIFLAYKNIAFPEGPGTDGVPLLGGVAALFPGPSAVADFPVPASAPQTAARPIR